MATPLHILIAGVIGVAAYLVTSRALAAHSAFGSPRLIAAAVSLLGCIGLLQAEDGLLHAILLPAAALVVSVCLLLAVFAFRCVRENRLRRDDTPSPKKSPKKPKAHCDSKGGTASINPPARATCGRAPSAHNPW